MVRSDERNQNIGQRGSHLGLAPASPATPQGRRQADRPNQKGVWFGAPVIHERDLSTGRREVTDR